MSHLESLPKKVYELNKAFYKDDTRLDGWNPGEQHTTFLQMLRIEDMALTPFRGASVLDVGCGTGELSRYLTRMEVASYTGLDIMMDAIKKAKAKYPQEKFPNRSFAVEDILTDTTEATYDYVFASGALSINLSSISINNYDFAESMIDAMWRKTRSGLVFNVLTDTSPNPHGELFFYNNKAIERICLNVAPTASLKVVPSVFTHYGKTSKDFTALSHFYLYNNRSQDENLDFLKPSSSHKKP